MPDGHAEKVGHVPGVGVRTRRWPDRLPGITEVGSPVDGGSAMRRPSGKARSKGGEVLGSIIWIVVFVACQANQLVLEVHTAQCARPGNEQNWTTD